jgi:PAS domain S-box-containing protein
MGHGYCYRWEPGIIWSHAISKAITAGASLATAAALVPLVPRALLLPSPAQLRLANQELSAEIAERRRIEDALQLEHNVVSAILNTVGAAIVVLDPDGLIVQCNRAFKQISGIRNAELAGRLVGTVFSVPEEGERFSLAIGDLSADWQPSKFECPWSDPNGEERLFAWSTTALAGTDGKIRNLIASGVDITEGRRLERVVLDISGREQARIAQDLHDDLGQHLTGIVLLSMAQEKRLSRSTSSEIQENYKIDERGDY